jgi:hypothetical protein
VGPDDGSTTPKTIFFGGTFGDAGYDHCVIENRIWETDTEKRELLLFSGNDPETTAGPDRIRLRGANIVFDTYSSPTVDRNAENIRMTIRQSGNVGIGTTNPNSLLTFYKNYPTPANGSEPAADTTQGITFRSDLNSFAGSPAPTWSIGSTVDVSKIWFQPRSYQNISGAAGHHGYLAFGTGYFGTLSNTPTMVINTGGKVGIGTTYPFFPLHVVGAKGGVGSGTRRYFRYDEALLTSSDTSITGAGSIFATDAIITNSYFTSTSGTANASDERIKKDIIDIDDGDALQTLRQLKPKKYKYKDTVKRGTEPVWGFIAQEVRDVLPYATFERKDFIPNIYELADVSDSNVITFTTFNTSTLSSNVDTTIKLYGIDDKEHEATIVEVIDDHTIRVAENLDEWTGSVDENGNVITETTTETITLEEYEALESKDGYTKEEDDTFTKTITTYPGTNLFVYGQQVDDFLVLKKDAIFTVATSALQEIDRHQQADKLRIGELETQLASVLARLDALESA